MTNGGAELSESSCNFVFNNNMSYLFVLNGSERNHKNSVFLHCLCITERYLIHTQERNTI